MLHLFLPSDFYDSVQADQRPNIIELLAEKEEKRIRRYREVNIENINLQNDINLYEKRKLLHSNVTLQMKV